MLAVSGGALSQHLQVEQGKPYPMYEGPQKRKCKGKYPLLLLLRYEGNSPGNVCHARKLHCLGKTKKKPVLLYWEVNCVRNAECTTMMKTWTFDSFLEGVTGVVINGFEKSKLLLYMDFRTDATHFCFNALSVFHELLLPAFYSWLIKDLHMDVNVLCVSMAICWTGVWPLYFLEDFASEACNRRQVFYNCVKQARKSFYINL